MLPNPHIAFPFHGIVLIKISEIAITHFVDISSTEADLTKIKAHVATTNGVLSEGNNKVYFLNDSVCLFTFQPFNPAFVQ